VSFLTPAAAPTHLLEPATRSPTAVAIPMKNVRLTMNHEVFSAEILTFSLRY